MTRRAVAALALATAATAVSLLAAGCGSVPARRAVAHSARSIPAAQKGHAAPALEALLPRQLDGVALDRASTTGKAIFAEFGGTAWAQQMTKYLASVGKTPADLNYAQVWDPSGALGLDAGAFEANGVGAAALEQAIINSSRPDSPNLAISHSSISGKQVTLVVNESSGTTLYLYDYRADVFYTGGSDSSLAAQFLAELP